VERIVSPFSPRQTDAHVVSTERSKDLGWIDFCILGRICLVAARLALFGGEVFSPSFPEGVEEVLGCQRNGCRRPLFFLFVLQWFS
jgi:hypothetical protein